jgi:tripartite-type tricarboxylate transporter receptor subunit TctC
MPAEVLVPLFVAGYVALALIGHAMLRHDVLRRFGPSQRPQPPLLPIGEGKTVQLVLCVAIACALAAAPAAADTYPSRPIRIVVPFPAGGGADATTRIVAESLARRLGQPVYVENKGGSGGVLGTEAVARSPADGYTLLVTTDGFASTPHVLKTTLDFSTSLVPVAQLTRQPVVLAVHPSLDVNSVAELVALGRRQSRLSYATSGIASPQAIAPLWFAQIAGVRLEPVPYRGGAPAINDLIAGHVKIGSIGVAPLIPHYRAGTVRFLAQTGETRAPSLPDVPTYQEAGIEGLVLQQWFGAFVPAGTPAAIIARLNAEIGQVLADPAVRATLAQSAQEAVGGSVEDFARLVREDTAKYARLVKELKIKAD